MAHRRCGNMLVLDRTIPLSLKDYCARKCMRRFTNVSLSMCSLCLLYLAVVRRPSTTSSAWPQEALDEQTPHLLLRDSLHTNNKKQNPRQGVVTRTTVKPPPDYTRGSSRQQYYYTKNDNFQLLVSVVRKKHLITQTAKI